MSQISDIISAVEALTVVAGSKTPVVFGVDNAVDSVRQTPARVVFPIQSGDNEGQSFEPLTLGGSLIGNWQIADLLLYAPVKKGMLLAQSMPHLLTYQANYLTAVKNNKKLGLNHCTIINTEIETNSYEFPQGTENEYFGVLCLLTVREVIP